MISCGTRTKLLLEIKCFANDSACSTLKNPLCNTSQVLVRIFQNFSVEIMVMSWSYL